MEKSNPEINSKMKFKAVLFDMDGVLTDSFESCFRTFNFTLEHFGKSAITKDEFIENCWGTPTDYDLELYLGKDADIKQASGFYHSNYARFVEYSRIFPDTIKILKFVKDRGFKTAVVTNTHRELTLKILKKFNLLNYFDAVFGGDDVKNGKPNPEIMIKACSTLEVLPDDAVVVGDTHADILAGKNAGCFTIGIRVNGDLRIENLGELLKYLE